MKWLWLTLLLLLPVSAQAQPANSEAVSQATSGAVLQNTQQSVSQVSAGAILYLACQTPNVLCEATAIQIMTIGPAQNALSLGKFITAVILEDQTEKNSKLNTFVVTNAGIMSNSKIASFIVTNQTAKTPGLVLRTAPLTTW